MFVLLLIASLMLLGCDKEVKVKAWCGSTSIDLPAGRKFIQAQWEYGTLWYTTREMRKDETAEIFYFKQRSGQEGEILFVEHPKAEDPALSTQMKEDVSKGK